MMMMEWGSSDNKWLRHGRIAATPGLEDCNSQAVESFIHYQLV